MNGARPYFAGLFIASLAIAQPAATAPPGQLPEITSQTETSGWNDLVLAIQVSRVERDNRIFIVRGLHGGKTVGFQVEIPQAWKRQTKAGLMMWLGTVKFRSLGKESDSFLQALGMLYGANSVSGKMKEEVSFDAILVNEQMEDIEKKRLHPKLFIQAQSESDYGEIYFNIDLPKAEVMMKEKDPEYRPMIVKAFAQQAER